MAKGLVKKHWFHGKAPSAKKKYLKKHPKSIFAGARTAVDNTGAQAYRMTVAHMRAEIDQLKKHIHDIAHDDSRYMSLARKLQMLQRKLAMFKRMH